MQERQYTSDNFIAEQDIFSGNSKVTSELVNWAINIVTGVPNYIVVSYDKTPEELLQIFSQLDNVIIDHDGKIGIRVEHRKEIYQIGEYKLIASAEHCFNAVICCFYGPDAYNLDNPVDSSIFLTATSIITGSLHGIEDVDVMLLLFSISSDHGFLSMYFNNNAPIAQQVFDSEFWNNSPGTISSNPPIWFLSIQSQKSNSKGGCYIATSVYGSYDCAEVWTLRRYRDYNLANHWYGRLFIYTYYAISPVIVRWFGEHKWFNDFWRKKLNKIVENLKREGYSSLPYDDKTW